LNSNSNGINIFKLDFDLIDSIKFFKKGIQIGAKGIKICLSFLPSTIMVYKKRKL
jgi:hypothetical protein